MSIQMRASVWIRNGSVVVIAGGINAVIGIVRFGLFTVQDGWRL